MDGVVMHPESSYMYMDLVQTSRRFKNACRPCSADCGAQGGWPLLDLLQWSVETSSPVHVLPPRPLLVHLHRPIYILTGTLALSKKQGYQSQHQEKDKVLTFVDPNPPKPIIAAMSSSAPSSSSPSSPAGESSSIRSRPRSRFESRSRRDSG